MNYILINFNKMKIFDKIGNQLQKLFWFEINDYFYLKTL